MGKKRMRVLAAAASAVMVLSMASFAAPAVSAGSINDTIYNNVYKVYPHIPVKHGEGEAKAVLNSYGGTCVFDFAVLTAEQLKRNNDWVKAQKDEVWKYVPGKLEIYSTELGEKGLTRVYEMNDGDEDGEFLYDSKYMYVAIVTRGHYEKIEGGSWGIPENAGPYKAANNRTPQSVYTLHPDSVKDYIAGKTDKPEWDLEFGYANAGSDLLLQIAGLNKEWWKKSENVYRLFEYNDDVTTTKLSEIRAYYDKEADGYAEADKILTVPYAYYVDGKDENGESLQGSLDETITGKIYDDPNDPNSNYSWGKVPNPAYIGNVGDAYGVSINISSDMRYRSFHWEADTQTVTDLGFGKRITDSTIYGSFLGTRLRYIDTIRSKTKVVFNEGVTPPKEGEPYPENMFPDITNVPVTKESLDPGFNLPTDPKVTTKPAELADHGDVYLLKDATVIDQYSGNDFDSGRYYITDYDPDSVYYIAVEVNVNKRKERGDDGYCDYNLYRWSPAYNYWEFRCNTAPKTAEVSVSPEFFPMENAKASLWKRATDAKTKEEEEHNMAQYNALMEEAEEIREQADKLPAGNEKDTLLKKAADTMQRASLFLVLDQGNMIQDWSKKDFNKGKKTATIDMENFLPGDNFYTVQFDYKDDGIKLYRYVGIDPVYTKQATGDAAFKDYATMIPTTARIGDTVHVTGTDKDGIPSDYDYYVSDKGDIPVRDGNFRLEDKDTGIFADVIVEDGNMVFPNVDIVNLTEPVTADQYTIYKPNGDILDRGDTSTTLKGVFDSISDTALTTDALDKDAVYHPFLYESGVLNSINGKPTTEKGYIITKDGDIKKILESELAGGKGDVNLDGSVDVLDVVYMTKYIHNKQPFGIKNFINADVMADGNADVYDLGVLKKLIVK